MLPKEKLPPVKSQSSNSFDIEACSFSLLQARKTFAQGGSTINKIGVDVA